MNFRNWKIWSMSRRISEIYGTLIAFGLILFMFFMYAIGLIHVLELRLLNLGILLAGVYYALLQYRRTHGTIDYFRGLVLGTSVSFIGTSTFALFLFIYLMVDDNLMHIVKDGQELGVYLNPYIASFVVWLEGIFSGFTVTFILVNYLQPTKTGEPSYSDK